MNCNPELVSAFLDGELEPVIYKAVIKHLMVCPRCRQTLSQLAQAREVVTSAFTLPDPERLTANVMAALPDLPGYSASDKIRENLIRYGLPTALAAAALSSMAQQSFGKPPAAPTHAIHERHTTHPIPSPGSPAPAHESWQRQMPLSPE
jgi:anti-sigma factor RsiW